jgi:hypothetical protein
VYESERATEQLDDISDWLDRCAAPSLLRPSFPVHRVPVTIVQGRWPGYKSDTNLNNIELSALVPERFGTLGARAHTLHGREAVDLASATKGIAIGFVGEAVSYQQLQKCQTNGMRRCWLENLVGRGLTRSKDGGRSRRTVRSESLPLLVWPLKGFRLGTAFACTASSTSSSASPRRADLHSVVSFLIISTSPKLTTRLHPLLPIRVLLSVPSTTLFLSMWQHIEPSAIDVSILQSCRGRGQAGCVDAILEVSDSPTDR